MEQGLVCSFVSRILYRMLLAVNAGYSQESQNMAEKEKHKNHTLDSLHLALSVRSRQAHSRRQLFTSRRTKPSFQARQSIRTPDALHTREQICHPPLIPVRRIIHSFCHPPMPLFRDACHLSNLVGRRTHGHMSVYCLRAIRPCSLAVDPRHTYWAFFWTCGWLPT